GNGLTLSSAFSSFTKYLTMKSAGLAVPNACASLSCKLNVVKSTGVSIHANNGVIGPTTGHGFTTSSNLTTVKHFWLVSVNEFSTRTQTVEVPLKKFVGVVIKLISLGPICAPFSET